MKRSGYISWDEYFMGVSLLAAKRSKDPNTQVGACIVDSNNIILSTGYNGFPYGCSDDLYPWEREGEDTKYNYVVHAELNAIPATNVPRRSFSRALQRWSISTTNTPIPPPPSPPKKC